MQEWVDGTKHTLYMREKEGRTLQYYEETKKEAVRFDDAFTLGHQWAFASRQRNGSPGIAIELSVSSVTAQYI